MSNPNTEKVETIHIKNRNDFDNFKKVEDKLMNKKIVLWNTTVKQISLNLDVKIVKAKLLVYFFYGEQIPYFWKTDINFVDEDIEQKIKNKYPVIFRKNKLFLTSDLFDINPLDISTYKVRDVQQRVEKIILEVINSSM